MSDLRIYADEMLANMPKNPNTNPAAIEAHTIMKLINEEKYADLIAGTDPCIIEVATSVAASITGASGAMAKVDGYRDAFVSCGIVQRFNDLATICPCFIFNVTTGRLIFVKEEPVPVTADFLKAKQEATLFCKIVYQKRAVDMARRLLDFVS